MKGRFLLVNLDKHQTDVTMVSSIPDEAHRDADAWLTMIVDVDRERVYCGGAWRPMTYRVVPFGLTPTDPMDRELVK